VERWSDVSTVLTLPKKSEIKTSEGDRDVNRLVENPGVETHCSRGQTLNWNVQNVGVSDDEELQPEAIGRTERENCSQTA